mmetsp:Transcript_201/g.377  ORF Transcript_201/g.377 Transcript_201/m.377 type:complete len:125 (-) Transcript_201:88-462(-)|eukprot:CAMPEP_0197473782 /NCGR_PEP_ID=MMETSP1309-20131121/5191_1 /TAXON_ID=464262 /ORGANISM="Genus nov. species nov., Strain RCC998" /LENGTH=124 /DNA_ID=CAMNT_0043013105 /DNA_START=75 /DNA_END=449 /DNA_ORIENTATION=-
MATSLVSQARQFWNHPAGPKTIHFWAPTFKWGISLANIADFYSPVEKVSAPQQCAVALTGIIWARFSTQIKPVNYNLMTVNMFMGITGMYQLYRLASHKMRGEWKERRELRTKQAENEAEAIEK